MRFTPNMKMNCRDRSNGVQFVMKTRQDNNMIDHASVFNVKNDIELL